MTLSNVQKITSAFERLFLIDYLKGKILRAGGLDGIWIFIWRQRTSKTK